MKYLLALPLLVSLIACGNNPHMNAAPDMSSSKPLSTSAMASSGTGSRIDAGIAASETGTTSDQAAVIGEATTEPATQTYDMLRWMTMRPSLRAAHHMSGTANPIYTEVLP